MSMLRVGVLGAGQLGRMLALAGYPLGVACRFLEPGPGAPVAPLAELLEGSFEDPEALDRFAAGLDVATFEFENVPAGALQALAERCPVRPGPRALEVGQDRLDEKCFFRELGIPVPSFEAVDDRAGLERAVDSVGLPAVLKTRRLGYDGKGQVVLREITDLEQAWRRLGGRGLLLEAWVPFHRELAVIAARGLRGEETFYPVVETEHSGGILRRSTAPAPDLDPDISALARDYASRILGALDYVGILALELFQSREGLLANEMAPRVHNSAHWTLEGAETSQFENHLRAICGLPLGSTSPVGCSVMLNLIGTLPDTARVLAVPGAHLHLYGKEPRPGRKLGHITVRADEASRARELAERVEALLEPPDAGIGG
jgi:5-(carboxyamino)imidazole ribonucleotide synthase